MNTTETIGIIGMGTMGRNLAKNCASRGIITSVFNRTAERTKELVAEDIPTIKGFFDLTNFVISLPRPRIILLVVPAGNAVDSLIARLFPLLGNDDIIVDMGNSHYTDTERRQKELTKGCVYDIQTVLDTNAEIGHKSIHLVGCGMSGGAQGALTGPSIMLGGAATALDTLIPLFTRIAAKDIHGDACVAALGSGGAGHFVKMVHNGIEYALMQCIAEIYDILKHNGYKNQEIVAIFTALNTGNTHSFLLDTTECILKTYTPNGSLLLELISDKADANGTGGWTVQASIRYAVPTPTIAAAVYSRMMSAMSRAATSPSIKKSYSAPSDTQAIISMLGTILESAYLLSFAQGIDLIRAANTEHQWACNTSTILKIWQGGCIIRSDMLSEPVSFFTLEQVSPETVTAYTDLQALLPHPVPTSALHSIIDMIKTHHADLLPTNLIQATRDFFGEHGYTRTDTQQTTTGGWLRSSDEHSDTP